MHNYIGILFLALLSSPALAQVESRLGQVNPFLGKAGVAGPASIDASSLNPAQAGELENTQVQLGWGMLSRTFMQRNKGFPSHSNTKTGTDSPLPIPNFVYKLSPRIGIGGLLIPFPVKQDIEATEIPIVILEQENLVDITGNGELSAYANVFAGFRVTQKFSLGARFNYIAFEGDGSVTNSENSSQELASFHVKHTEMAVGMGAKYQLSPSVTLGLSTALFRQTKDENEFKSAVSLKDGEEQEDTAPQEHTEYLNPITLGSAFYFSKRFIYLFDVKYTRAAKGKERYSIVDLANKELDSYDTYSVYTGLEFVKSENAQFMVGYMNEPSSLGQGAVGKDEKTGFGFIDVAQNLGEPPEAPQWQLALGARLHFMKEKTRKEKDKDKDKDKDKTKDELNKYRLTVESGFAYGETSIGVDDQGEQPGAYLVRRYRIPLKVIYHF